DEALVKAVERAGNVIVASQLASDGMDDEKNVWLRPLPEIERVAAGIGHVDVHTGFDGVARTLLLREADDDAREQWAMAIELVRVGEGLKSDSVRELPEALMIGKHKIPIVSEPNDLMVGSEGAGFKKISAVRMMIDYIGPTNAFAPQTVGIGDLIEG